MLDRNAERVGNLKQVSNDITHDLRAPLARLQQVLAAAIAHAHHSWPELSDNGPGLRYDFVFNI